jgi:glucokinase
MKNEEQKVTAPSTSPARTENLPLVMGIDLGGTQIRTSVLRGATLLSRIGLLTGENPTPERIVPRMFQAVEQALAEAGTTIKQIAGIGIGAPGPLNSHTGVVFAPPNLPGWVNVPLRDLFSEHFHIPIFVENDANAAALAEYMFGAGRGSSEVVYVTISTGIGGGIITGGKLLEGVSGTAGELGHMTIDLHGERCNCGNVGCLESIASGTAIARSANEMIAMGKGDELLAFALKQQQDGTANTPVDSAHLARLSMLHVNARTVAQAAKAGIPLARQIITNAAEGLGVGLVNIIHIFNPEIIILGGGVAQIGEMLMEPVRRIIQRRAMKVPREAVRIVAAQLGTDVGIIGAGALSYYNKSGKEDAKVASSP